MNAPKDKIQAWKRETMLDRVVKCEAMLAIHGFLSGAEIRNVQKRIIKWVEKQK